MILDVAFTNEHSCTEQVVHMDLKPLNIMLDQDGTIKLGDFGVSAFKEKMGYEPRKQAEQQGSFRVSMNVWHHMVHR